MSILYVTEQGAVLVKRGKRLAVEKLGRQIHWVHAFKTDQVILMGNVGISTATIAFLLEQGIDTVFLSYHGKFRGRLISKLGKNVELRRLQFQKMDDPCFRLQTAKACVSGKINNCRVLLRRHNQDRRDDEVKAVVHRLRNFRKRVADSESIKSLMGVEGAASATYFKALGKLIAVREISFSGRNRRPPRDPFNVLLSLGYTLLANAMDTQVTTAGLDPYLGCLHGVEYGRPSLVLDLIEEFRPVLVDALVLKLVNKRIIKHTDFFRPDEREPAAFDFAETDLAREDYPILLIHEGMKKFITRFEERLSESTPYVPGGRRLSRRQILLEQVRVLIRSLNGESPYVPYCLA